MLKFIPLFCLLLISHHLFAQHDQPGFTSAFERVQSFEKRKILSQNSLVKEVEFKSIGPVVQSGRVSEVAVDPNDATHFYVAYASGGLWETKNNGISFHPLFQNEMVMTIGAITVDWKNNIIWLGSGEVNSSRSSYSGTGIFKSTDGGKTFEHQGLGESHHIGRIVLDPDNQNIIHVAVLGHLYSPNQERGVYKTTDGGKTWTRTLFVNQNAGAVDLVMDPNNSQVLYSAIWERERRAWNFSEGGKGSAIYKSEDGGNNWQALNMGDKFPTGKGAGRIGLAITSDNGKSILYTCVDNQDRRPKEKDKTEKQLTKDALRTMNKATFLALDDQLIQAYLQQYNFPKKYKLKKVKSLIKNDEIRPLALVEYVEDANSLLFDTPVVGLEIYRTDDDGKNWQRTHADYLDNVYYSYGYYFGQIRVSPQNADKIYVFGVPIIKSEDGGKTFSGINAPNVHVDHHDLWINPTNDKHLISGNDGGINISYDDGKNWIKCNSPAVGQFYTVAVDMAEPFNVYGGFQDNGVWKGPHTNKESNAWQQTGQYPFKMIMGGDGMQVAIDSRDNATVYTGFQFGNYFRINTETQERAYITPKHNLGERPLRWNWQTPIHLSVHNQDILYMGANKVYRSFNQGDDFEPISEDLTTGGRKGDVAYSTLSSIHESSLKFGLLYAGSDDGLVHCSMDGGHSWKNVSTGLPKYMWVSRVQASRFREGRVYVSLNGYRWDNFKPMCFVSEDYGMNWTRIGKDLPLEPINVIKEDTENANILYVGTDNGLYISLDKGEHFMLMSDALPAVAIHDLVIHPRDKKLVVGTHGRSLYMADLTEIQQLTKETLAKNIHLFNIQNTRYSSRWGKKSWFSDRTPSITIPLYTASSGKVQIDIKTDEGLLLHHFETEVKKGLHYVDYDISINEKTLTEYNKFLNKGSDDEKDTIEVKKADNGKIYLYEGVYTVSVRLGTDKFEGEFEIE